MDKSESAALRPWNNPIIIDLCLDVKKKKKKVLRQNTIWPWVIWRMDVHSPAHVLVNIIIQWGIFIGYVTYVQFMELFFVKAVTCTEQVVTVFFFLKVASYCASHLTENLFFISCHDSLPLSQYGCFILVHNYPTLSTSVNGVNLIESRNKFISQSLLCVASVAGEP